MPHAENILLLCRPGFESECAAEAMELAAAQQLPAYIKTKTTDGFVCLCSNAGMNVLDMMAQMDFRQLIFTRQWLAFQHVHSDLPENDRVTPLLTAARNFNVRFADVEYGWPDTNEGKSMSRFCQQFSPHLNKALHAEKLLSTKANHGSGWRLHFFFIDSQHVYCGISPLDNNASDSMGIPRLRMPAAAPSRSTLKLDEAIHWFLNAELRAQLFKPGMRAVDLGAAPGGWSWQLVQRGLLVTAIDNGALDAALLRSGMIEHYRVDAFTFVPEHAVDWLVCDMAERPLHVTRLIASWFTQRRCKHAIFNLKLPMKQRYHTLTECLTLLDKALHSAGTGAHMQCKQLYHDREEVTVCVHGAVWADTAHSR